MNTSLRPATGGRRRAPFTWNALLWSLVFPQRAHRIIPTVPGMVLISLSLGIGMAAYNSSSNILFLTLSLLLASLVFSGVLSWLNLRRVTWRLEAAPALRVGHETLVGLELRNTKSLLPTYGLVFRLLAQARRSNAIHRAESTVTARGQDIRAALAQAEADQIRGEVKLAGRLDPQGAARLDWVLQPSRRGLLRIQLTSVVSLFPFGFLRKAIGTADATEVVVWPATIAYHRHAPPVARRRAGDERVARAGSGSDLLTLRRYQVGDSHRLIHWKASARTRQLLVRQFAAEIAEGCVVWIRTDAAAWPRAEQFELLVSFAATLTEDLFRAGRLQGVAINDEAVIRVGRLSELEVVLNRLAVLERQESAPSGPPNFRQVLKLAPEGVRGVGAFMDGQLVASA